MKILLTLLLVLMPLLSWAQPADSLRRLLDSPVELISSEALAREAGRNAWSVQVASGEAEVAAFRADAAAEWIYPEFQSGFDIHGRSGTAMNSDGFFFRDMERNRFRGGLYMNFEWDYGRSRYETEAARHEAAAAGRRVAVAKNKAVFQARQHGILLRARLAELAVLDSLIRLSRRIEEQLRVQYESGIAHKSAWLLARSKRNELAGEREALLGEARAASQRLGKALGRKPSDTLLVTAEGLSAPELSLESEGIQRPELDVFAAQKRAAEARLDRYRKGLWYPSIRVWGLAGPIGPVGTPWDLTGDGNVSVLWSIPLDHILGGGKLRQHRQAMEVASIKQQELQVEATNELSALRKEVLSLSSQEQRLDSAQTDARAALQQAAERQKRGLAEPYSVFENMRHYLRLTRRQLQVRERRAALIARMAFVRGGE